MSGYYGPSGSYLYDSEEYITLTKAAHDALAARVRELEEALRVLRDAHDGEHEPLCAISLPQKECDCALGVIDAALTPEEPQS